MARSIFFLLGLLAVVQLNAAPGTEGIPPVSPQDSLKLIRTKPGLEVQLAASEPAIVDPVVIDWGADGKLWVCEMHDYPTGMDGNWQPGGRIKILEDADGDGFYEKATLFLQDLPFPTGVTAWGKGAFICAAPDLIYAEDTNGDGKADRVEKVFSGFATENYQARLNSLAIGLDNWIYGANGLLGGVIRGVSKTGAEINIRNHDFRFDPFTGAFEGVSGVTQYGRVRDDWGNWFGCNNSDLLFYFPWNERYSQRNPAIALPAANVHLPTGKDTARIFPTSKLQERYNDLDNANRVTSAGGLGIYRDTLLGEEYYGNAFTGEAVHNLVHREIISGDGVKFKSQRARDEQESEFLSSSDNWFRPAQIRTGPDGALYVVDMYRFLIEHPRWIAAKRLAEIDVRAGSDKGRIYRVKPIGKGLRPIPNLRAMSAVDLAAAMDSPNGTERDRVHIELLTRRDASAAPALIRLASASKLPQVRLQALSAADGLGGLNEAGVLGALRDSDAHVRANALRISESFLVKTPSAELIKTIVALASDASPVATHQLAYTLGELNDPRAGAALAGLAKAHTNDSNLRLKILTSAKAHARQIFESVGDIKEWRGPLLSTIATSDDSAALDAALKNALSQKSPENFTELTVLLDGASKRKIDLSQQVGVTVNEARQIAFAGIAAESSREAALKLITKVPANEPDVAQLAKLAVNNSNKLRSAALTALRQHRNASVAREILNQWPQASPAVRAELLPMLIERQEWTRVLLENVKKGTVQAGEISPTERQRILQSDEPEIQKLASSLFSRDQSTTRDAVIQKYAEVKTIKGQTPAGAESFARNCASCHALKGSGHAVGPDLAALRDKDADYFVKNILDPNAVVEPRFVAYNVELNDDRSILGIIKSENASALTLIMGGGQTETVARSDIKEIRASTLSLMPEGLEQAINVKEMADLVAYLNAGSGEPAKSPGSEVVLRDPVSVARFVLDDSQPTNLRENAIKSNPQFAGALILELTRDLTPGTPEEYRRIPWIWRVAIASGKRNEVDQLRRVLEASLPSGSEPLRNWQAVVIGGGVINGISQRGQWPRERIEEIIGGEGDLRKRWARALDLASVMTDNEQVPSGTRYDALRMLGVEPWSKRGAQLVRYLENKNGELQMGAVSGLGDVNSPEAKMALREALPKLTEGNRRMAEEALKRFEKRRKD